MTLPTDPKIQIFPVEDVLDAFAPRVRPSVRSLRADMLRRGCAFAAYGRVVTTHELVAKFLAGLCSELGPTRQATPIVSQPSDDLSGFADVQEALIQIATARKRDQVT